ncbi:MAG TPA: hypothetical protein VJP79_00255 [Nitrososphaera sp.]|nr:hypothetical protein [Nitrososphaera sp.]
MGGRNFFRKYRAAILFNKNLLISGTAGLLASAYTSQLFSQFDRNELANSAVALATEYAVYLPLFSILFYLDNRQKYRDPETGRKDYGRVRSDVKKLFASFSVSEIVYSIVRIGSQYGLLTLDVEAYEASILSSLTAWGVFFASINLMASLTKLHDK